MEIPRWLAALSRDYLLRAKDDQDVHFGPGGYGGRALTPLILGIDSGLTVAPIVVAAVSTVLGLLAANDSVHASAPRVWAIVAAVAVVMLLVVEAIRDHRYRASPSMSTPLPGPSLPTAKA